MVAPNKMGITKNHLDKLTDISATDGLQMMKKAPARKLAWIYAKFAKPEQLAQILAEYDKFIKNPGHYPAANDWEKIPGNIKGRYLKKIKFLLRAIKKRQDVPEPYKTEYAHLL